MDNRITGRILLYGYPIYDWHVKISGLIFPAADFLTIRFMIDASGRCQSPVKCGSSGTLRPEQRRGLWLYRVTGAGNMEPVRGSVVRMPVCYYTRPGNKAGFRFPPNQQTCRSYPEILRPFCQPAGKTCRTLPEQNCGLSALVCRADYPDRIPDEQSGDTGK